MKQVLLPALSLMLAGCFTARPGAESGHDRIHKGMSKEQVRWEIGAPKEVTPVPGQEDSKDVPTEQWSYVYSYTQGKIFTILLTAFLGLFFMDFNPYGFDVGFSRSGRVVTISEVRARPK